jgi:diaminopimelate decarboxylase
MQYFTSEHFSYRNNNLFCEDVPLKKIIEKTGTPVYVYSKKFFENRFKEFTEAFKEIPHTIFYAVKSNFNLSVIKTFVSLGSGVDVNSEGELYRALKTGVNPKKIILTGVGKTEMEINLGLQYDLLMIKAESEDEVFLINEMAGKLNKRAPVAIRVNPDVNPQTHPYISTGLAENKFGVNPETAINIFKEAKKLKHINFTGIDMHIGSQITSVEPFIEAVKKLSDLYFKVKLNGINLEHFDIGGGIGTRYFNEETFTIREFADGLIPELKKLNCKIFFEPGRYLTANGGILAAQVAYIKNNDYKNFIITDAAMNDLLRPSIYRAYHHIQPEEINRGRKDILADIVGPVCESGDFLAKDRNISEMKSGDYICIMSAGAYGLVMSSNYNARRRPPEVLVDGEQFKIIRSRETFDHLIYDEEKYLE